MRNAGDSEQAEQRILRPTPTAVTTVSSPAAAPEPIPPKPDPEREQLFALASKLGYDLTPSANNLKEIALSILLSRAL